METSEGGVNVAQLNHGLDAGDFGLSHAMQVPSPIHYIEEIQCFENTVFKHNLPQCFEFTNFKAEATPLTSCHLV